ncbi:MAG: pyridoxal-dependent decarboxylase [Roseivirga sp.]|nr:pyridoxal-dependent decarboxylase [Roseivirga sp.]
MKNNTLDLDNKAFRELLEKSNQLVLEQFGQVQEQPGYHDYKQEEVASWFDEALPEEASDKDELFQFVRDRVLNTATGNFGPHMYAYVMAGGTQVSVVAEQLAVTINQNLGKWHLGPAMNEIEQRVVKWGAEMLDYPQSAGGIMVSGGSAANLAGLTVARNVFFEKLQIRKKGLFGQKPFVVYASKEVHGCVDKSLEVLGIGSDHLRKIDTNPDFTINLQALEDQIMEDRKNGLLPFCLIGNAGTVNTGAIDDLEALAALAKKYSLWYHVDGAYGALAAALPSIRHKYRGMEKADSVAIDFHKWLYQTFEAGCVLIRDWKTLKGAYYKEADYLDTQSEDDKRLDLNKHSFQLSRNAKAFKVWLSLKAYGFNAIRAMIQKDVDLAKYLAEQVKSAADFELHADSDLAITCFRYTGKLTDRAEIESLNRQLIPALEQDGRVFITGTKLNGEFVIRACFINHRKSVATTDYLLNVIREVGQQLELDK